MTPKKKKIFLSLTHGCLRHRNGFSLARHKWFTPVIPRYSGGRDQEDHGSKPILGKLFVRPYLEKTFTKKSCCHGSRCRP
jgi:hypothetical protein